MNITIRTVLIFLLAFQNQAYGLVSPNPINILENLQKNEEKNAGDLLFYKITNSWNEKGFYYYGNKEYRVIENKKNRSKTFIKNDILLSELYDNYKKSKPLSLLGKVYANYIQEDKENNNYFFSNLTYKVDNSISFNDVLLDIINRGENILIKKDTIVGNLKNDKLLSGFDNLIYSDGIGKYQFKIRFKDNKALSYEFYMFSGEGEYRKKRWVKVERSLYKKIYRWPSDKNIIKRSELEEMIINLSLPRNKIIGIDNVFDKNSINIYINKEKLLEESYILKLKKGYVIFSEIRDRKNYLDAICFELLESINDNRACDVEDMPDFNAHLQTYIDSIDRMVDEKYSIYEVLSLMNVISHSLFLYDTGAIKDQEDYDKYRWYYINKVSRYLDTLK